jgi:hypothetical protein
MRFYSQTDIELEGDHTKNWKQYALWLENLKVEEITEDLVKTNQRFDRAIQDTINVLERAYSAISKGLNPLKKYTRFILKLNF